MRGNTLRPFVPLCRGKVGEWEFPGLENQMFWSPPDCVQSSGPDQGRKMHLIHKDANLKPYRIQLFWVAPAAGTGV